MVIATFSEALPRNSNSTAGKTCFFRKLRLKRGVSPHGASRRASKLHLLRAPGRPDPGPQGPVVAGAHDLGPVEGDGEHDALVAPQGHGALPRREVRHGNRPVGAARYHLFRGPGRMRTAGGSGRTRQGVCPSCTTPPLLGAGERRMPGEVIKTRGCKECCTARFPCPGAVKDSCAYPRR